MIHIGAGAILERAGKILVVREKFAHKDIGKKAGAYSIPVGHVKEDETIHESVIREFKEETGFDIELVSLIGVYRRDIIIGPIFMAKEVGENVIINEDDSILEVSWMNPDELLKKDNLRPLIRECIEDYLMGKSYPIKLIRDTTGLNRINL